MRVFERFDWCKCDNTRAPTGCISGGHILADGFWWSAAISMDNGVAKTLAQQNLSELKVHNDNLSSPVGGFAALSLRPQRAVDNLPKQTRLGIFSNSQKMNVCATKDFTSIESYINHFGSGHRTSFGSKKNQVKY